MGIPMALGLMMVIAPIAAVILHAVFKPRFWLPVALVFGCAVPVMGFASYVQTQSYPESLKGALIFGFLAGAISVAVGFAFRLVFRKQYRTAGERAMRLPGFLRRTRVAGLAGICLGLLVILLIGPDIAENYPAFLGGVMFIALGAVYLFARRGGATLSKWIREGVLVVGDENSVNSAVDSDERKSGTQRLS